MTILDESEKVQTDAKGYLDLLGPQFISGNKGKSIIVFPYLKEHIIADNPYIVNEFLRSPKYQNAKSFVFNL